MAKTGKSFDMNPDTFTLENLFAMELHNFKDVIGDIVTSASKELSIEKVLQVITKHYKFWVSFYWDGSVPSFYHVPSYIIYVTLGNYRRGVHKKIIKGLTFLLLLTKCKHQL